MRIRNEEYLPTALIKAVEGVFEGYREKRSKNNVLSIVGIIFHKHMNNPYGSESFETLSSKYWKKMIGSHYSPLLKRLIHHKIVQEKWVRYIPDGGKDEPVNVKGYRINPEYLNDEFKIIKYFEDKNRSIELIKDVELKSVGLPKGFSPYIKMLKKDALIWLNVNASELVNKSINSDFINGLPNDMPVKVRILDDNGSFYEQYLSVESAKQIAQDHVKELFYYKDLCVIADKPQFIDTTTRNLIFHYTWHIKTFDSNHLNLKRNKKTLRVYSQLTSLPSVLLPFIRMSNNYIMQADLKCSQFTIFANILNLYISNKNGDRLVNLFEKKQTKEFIKKLVTIFRKYDEIMPENGLNYNNPMENEHDCRNNDISKFLVDVLLHDFYDILKNELNLPQRALAKIIAFRTVFSNPKNSSHFVTKFDEIYHDVLSIINDFKNKYGYNQFAIGLQNVEAEIFIDKVWAQTIQSGITAFTRHDSMLFPINKKNEVESIMKNAFDEFTFIHKIEYDDFNEDEIDDLNEDVIDDFNEDEMWDYLMNGTSFLDSMDDEIDELFLYAMNNPKIDVKNDDTKKGADDLQDNGKDNNNDKNDDMIDYSEFEDKFITEEYFLNNIHEILEDEGIELPDEINKKDSEYDDDDEEEVEEGDYLPDDTDYAYNGSDVIDLLYFLIENVQGIHKDTKDAIEADIINIDGGMNTNLQPATIDYITRLIKIYNEF